MKYLTHKKQNDTHQLRKLPVLLATIALLLLFVQVLVSNSLATAGHQISQIETRTAQLSQENQQLEEQIASVSALLTIKEKAATIGFVKPVVPLFLSSDTPVAFERH